MANSRHSTYEKTISVLIFLLSINVGFSQTSSHELHFHALAKQWDEAIPLGNGMIGALVWQKGDSLRFSLDRADLWDMRPMKGLHRKEFSYQWVIDHVKSKEVMAFLPSKGQLSFYWL